MREEERIQGKEIPEEIPPGIPEEIPEKIPVFRTRRERYLSQGLCASCGRRAPLPNLTKCHACRERQRKNAARYRERKRKREALLRESQHSPGNSPGNSPESKDRKTQTGSGRPETAAQRGAGKAGIPVSTLTRSPATSPDQIPALDWRDGGLSTDVPDVPDVSDVSNVPTTLAALVSSARPVEVTFEDLLEGREREDNASCPVALALRRATRREWTVGSTFATASLGKGTHRQAVLSLPRRVQKFNRLLDEETSSENLREETRKETRERTNGGSQEERREESAPGPEGKLASRLPLTFLLREEDLRERNFYMGQDRFEEDGGQVRKNR